MDQDRELAKTALENDHDQFFCIECGRPRRIKYCPATARAIKPQRHLIVTRRMLNMDQQIELYVSNLQSR